MTSFTDKFPHNSLAETLGDDVIYKRGSKKIPLKAVVDRNVQKIGNDGTVIEYNTEIELLKNAIPFLPTRGDIITVKTEVFVVDAIIFNDGNWIRVAVR